MRTLRLISCWRARRAGAAPGGGDGRRAAVTLCTAAALLAACSFEYSDAGPSPQQLLEFIPETELTEVTHTIVRNGRVAAEFRAEQVRNFRRAGRTEMEEITYSEYDRDGILVTAGNADRAVYYTRRKDAELAGAIRLRSQSQAVWLEAESLRWEDERHRLTAGPEEPVEIVRDDGSRVTGIGLEVDVRRKTIRFSGSVEGMLVIDTAADQ
ncbi:MAG: LPS export ABC transporter periplasmic protein LptC [Rhodospirillaceae bacterium]|nr:LPS export ABC transporter periplasmic protein LptC [Rhodospirillaceae bacterium]